MRSPLIHYFKSFAAIALPNLLQFEETKNDAEIALKTFLEGRLAASSWDSSIRDYLIKNLENIATQRSMPVGQGQSQNQSQNQISTQQNAGAGTNAKADDNLNMITAANQGLQRLADLATASAEDNAEVQVAATADSTARIDKDGNREGGFAAVGAGKM